MARRYFISTDELIAEIRRTGIKNWHINPRTKQKDGTVKVGYRDGEYPVGSRIEIKANGYIDMPEPEPLGVA